MRAIRALMLGFSLSVASPGARAEPTLWQRLGHPNAAAEARLSRGVERLLDYAKQAETDPELEHRFARAAVALLDLARLPEPEDPRLGYLMARALVAADVGRGSEAVRLLERSIAKLPVGGLLAEAWFELGRARSSLGDATGARDAQSRALELAVEPEARARAFYARAGAELRLGELEPAGSDYEHAGAEASDELLRLRSRFGVALTLERRGDLPGAYLALEQVLFAQLPLSRYPSADPLEVPGGFEPAYELDYVRALAAMARAHRADAVDERRAAYRTASAAWEAYLDAAPPREPWVVHARALRDRVGAELRKLPAHERSRPRPAP